MGLRRVCNFHSAVLKSVYRGRLFHPTSRHENSTRTRVGLQNFCGRQSALAGYISCGFTKLNNSITRVMVEEPTAGQSLY